MHVQELQTLHIKYLKIDNDKNTYDYNKQELIRQIFKEFLINDPFSHYFIEPPLVIRAQKETISKIEIYLEEEYEFITYDYPTPSETLEERCYKENPDGIVMKYFDLFLKIFHAHSVAALRFTSSQHSYYRIIVVEILLSSGKYSLEKAGKDLEELAKYKLGNSCTSTQKFSKEDEDESVLLSDEFSTIATLSKKAEKKMSPDDYFLFMERVIHTMYNMAGFSRIEEGQYLLQLAKKKQKESVNDFCCLIF